MESPEHSRWFKTFTLWRKIQIFDSRNKISFWIIETYIIVIDSQENVLIFFHEKNSNSMNPGIFLFLTRLVASGYEFTFIFTDIWIQV